MEIFAGILGLIIFMFVLWLLSEDRKKVQFKYPLILLALSAGFALLFMKTGIGVAIASGLSTFFGWITECAMEGISFVFSNPEVAHNGTTIFFVQTLLPIVVITMLCGILIKFGVFQFITKWVGKFMSKVSGEDDLVGFESINAFMLSQTGAWGSTVPFIDKITERQTWAISLLGMGTFSTTIIAFYASMIPMKYVAIAIPMNMLTGLLVINLLFPRGKDNNNFSIDEAMVRPKESLLDIIVDYARIGWNMVVGIAISLIAFLSLIALLNMICSGIFGISFQDIMAYPMSVVAWLQGAGSESLVVGKILATKLLANEAVALTMIKGAGLSAHALAITATSLMSFSAVGSIGIISGCLKGLNEQKTTWFLKKAPKILLGAFLVAVINGTIVGLFI